MAPLHGSRWVKSSSVRPGLSPPPEHPRSDQYPRVLSVKPRRRGYVHRAIVVVADGLIVTETGEVVGTLSTVPDAAFMSDPCIWVTNEPAELLLACLDRFSEHPSFQYQVVTSEECGEDASMLYTKLTRFGFTRGRDKRANGRHRGMHTVWCPSDMTRQPADVLDGPGASHLLQFATDVRDWCRDNNIPLPTSLSGIAGSLLRDPRFWPDARGRVPRATNERTRPYLPGVYSELRADQGRAIPKAIGLDQKRAYHRAATEVPTPNPDNLYARGYFNEPETSPLWCVPGDPVYERTIRQPGLVAVRATGQHSRANTTRPPAVQPGGPRTIYLWTNELDLALAHGLIMHGLTAAWTSVTPDPGLPRYGAWATREIDQADDFRRRWLKPTLHATYGLLAAKPRNIAIGHYRGNGREAMRILGRGHEVTVHEAHLRGHAPPTANVPMLGVLQAEIRARSMRLANALMLEGVDVLHIHADGLHVAGPLPLVDDRWSVEPRDDLFYLDRVSWLSTQGDTLPGRDERERVDVRRRAAHLIDLASNPLPRDWWKEYCDAHATTVQPV